VGILLEKAVTVALLCLYLFSERPPSGIAGFLATYAVMSLVVAFNRCNHRRIDRLAAPVLAFGLSASAGAAHAQGAPYVAPDSAIAAAAGMAVRSADACAAVWPGYWHAGKPFGFTRRADSTIFVYVPAESPSAPYGAVQGRWLPPELRGALHARRGYPDGFGGIDVWFRVGGTTMAVTPAYHPSAEIVLEMLYHEGFHAHQWVHFTNVPGARPGFGGNLAPVRLEGSPEAYEALAEAERQALAAALVAPSRDSARSVLRSYLDLRERRAALAPDAQAVERWEEQREGTADYVGKLCAAYAIGAGREHARTRVRHALAERQPALARGRPSKWRAYAVGAALGLLLDDLTGDSWRGAVGAGTTLDAYLRGVLAGS
jgi:hypothetical protein